MHAIVVKQVGGPEVLEYVETSEPQIGAGDLLVRTDAIGVNYIDTYHRRGLYPRELPFTPGSEATGVVAEVGEGVTDFTVGDRVAWSDAAGSYAEFVSVPAEKAVAVPEGVTPEVAASTLLQGMTAHYLLNSVYRPDPGESILIHAGAGGVGLIMTQLAKIYDARVITTVSTDEKEQLSRAAGADEVLRYSPGLADQVRSLTAGEGVAAVYDGVGAATFEASLAALRVRGVCALFGASSGQPEPLQLQRLSTLGSLFVTRPTLAHYTRSRQELLWRATQIFDDVCVGALKIRIGASYRLADAAQAHRDLESRATTGSLVLLP